MKVLTLIPNQKGYSPGQRGSIELWEKVLKPVGVELEFVPFETDPLHRVIYTKGNYPRKITEMTRAYRKRVALLKNLDDYDAVFVYREAALIGPAVLEKYIAAKKPIIYQLDDPLYLPYVSPHSSYFSYLKFFGKIKEIIRISKVVMVNSSHIRRYAERFNKNIWQVPSVVDTEIFQYDPAAQNQKPVTVGWSGSQTTVGNLQMIREPLKQLANSGINLRFIGGADFNLPNIKHTAQVWNGATEVEDLRQIQIGLVPLPDNAWNKHKFIMKTAQYMALGIVPVGTPMASNPEVIRHGENGFLATTDEDWVRYIKMLVEDDQLRKRLSAQAAKDAQEKYSLQANTPKIIEAFKAALK